MRREHKGNSLTQFISDYVVVDIETTGLHPIQCEIIEIGAIKVRNHEVMDTFHMMIKPSGIVSPFISNLTGITNQMLEEQGVEPLEALSQFILFIEDDIIIGHNVHFDINFLYEHTLNQLGIFISNDFIDTVRLARMYLKGRVRNHKLGTLVQYFGFDYTGAHRALADCEFTRKIYNAIHEVSCGFQ